MTPETAFVLRTRLPLLGPAEQPPILRPGTVPRARLVRRDESERTHIYQPKLSEEQTQRQLVRDLLDRAFGGSASKLVMQALSARRATQEELGEIRKLIEGSRDGKEIRDER